MPLVPVQQEMPHLRTDLASVASLLGRRHQKLRVRNYITAANYVLIQSSPVHDNTDSASANENAVAPLLCFCSALSHSDPQAQILFMVMDISEQSINNHGRTLWTGVGMFPWKPRGLTVAKAHCNGANNEQKYVIEDFLRNEKHSNK